MKTIGIFYGSSGGNTQDVAKLIAKKLGVDNSNIFDVSSSPVDKLAAYDLLVLGSSTWGVGDLQDDWDGFIDKLAKQDLSGKEVAVFGTGDSVSYADSFCDAIGIIAKAAEKAGAKIIGKVETADYSFDDSQAVENGMFYGLPIDEDNESDKTEERVSKWVEQLKD
jgi:flavodoxin, long chain